MIEICQRSEIAECCTVIYRSDRKKKNEKWSKLGWMMIDARNEDELKSRADLFETAMDPWQIFSLIY